MSGLDNLLEQLNNPNWTNGNASQTKETSNSGKFLGPPSIEETYTVIYNLGKVLYPLGQNEKGYKLFKSDELLQRQLEMIGICLAAYTNEIQCLSQMMASKETAENYKMSTHIAKQLCA